MCKNSSSTRNKFKDGNYEKNHEALAIGGDVITAFIVWKA